jgi:hypothetical protein
MSEQLADFSDTFYYRAIRTRIGERLRTLFVPTEPPPKRLLELLHALDQPKGSDSSRVDEKSDEPLKKLPEAKRGRGTPPRRGKRARDELSETERIEKIQSGYLVRGANGEVLVYVYCRANESDSLEENVLTEDEARQLAIDVAKLSALMRRDE